MTRRVVVLGSTGSVGTQALEVVRANPDRLRVVGLAAGGDADTLAALAEALGVTDVALADREAARRLAERLPTARVRDGEEGVRELATIDADVVLNAVTGAVGLAPTLAALGAGTRVALANKESLVVGGDLVVDAASAAGGRRDRLIPVDSEHSALAQCLRGGRRDEVRRLVLTASGGPFRGASRDELADVTAEQALAHPTWDMGPVVTINSATMMNKGLEVIEAHLLFDVPWEALTAVVHPQSVVHSMVEFVDGSTVAQLSPPDMRLPIQAALTWPERPAEAFVTMDWASPHELTFEPADRDTFRALGLAERAGRRRGTAPAVLNAAVERAVAAFRDGALGFLGIAEVVGTVLDEHLAGDHAPLRDLEQLRTVDAWARRRAGELVGGREVVGTR